jgi:hypothetical protein
MPRASCRGSVVARPPSAAAAPAAMDPDAAAPAPARQSTDACAAVWPTVGGPSASSAGRSALRGARSSLPGPGRRRCVAPSPQVAQVAAAPPALSPGAPQVRMASALRATCRSAATWVRSAMDRPRRRPAARTGAAASSVGCGPVGPVLDLRPSCYRPSRRRSRRRRRPFRRSGSGAGGRSARRRSGRSVRRATRQRRRASCRWGRHRAAHPSPPHTCCIGEDRSPSPSRLIKALSTRLTLLHRCTADRSGPVERGDAPWSRGFRT